MRTFSKLRFFGKAAKDPIVVCLLVFCIALVILMTVQFGDSTLGFWGSLSESPALVISFLSMLLAYWAVAATNRVADKAASLESSERRRGIEGSKEFKDVLGAAAILADVRRIWKETGVWDALHFGACNRFEMSLMGESNPNLRNALVLDFTHVGFASRDRCSNLECMFQFRAPDFNAETGEVELRKVALPWTQEIETGRKHIRNFAFRVLSLLDMGGLTHEDARTLLLQIGCEVFSTSEVLDALEEKVTRRAKCPENRSPYDFELYYRLRELMDVAEPSFRYRKAKDDGCSSPSDRRLSVVDSEKEVKLYPHPHEYDFIDACVYCDLQPTEKLEEALKELSAIGVEKLRWDFQKVKMQFLDNRPMTANEILVWKYALMRKLCPQDIVEESFGKGFSEAYEVCCQYGSMMIYCHRCLFLASFEDRFPELFPGHQVRKPTREEIESQRREWRALHDLPEIIEDVEPTEQDGPDAP